MEQFNHDTGNILKLDGAKIYYQDLGNKNDRTLPMLHGGFGTIEDFNPILPILVNHFQIIAMDARGKASPH